jgi:hypothetical protein
MTMTAKQLAKALKWPAEDLWYVEPADLVETQPHHECCNHISGSALALLDLKFKEHQEENERLRKENETLKAESPVLIRGASQEAAEAMRERCAEAAAAESSHVSIGDDAKTDDYQQGWDAACETIMNAIRALKVTYE